MSSASCGFPAAASAAVMVVALLGGFACFAAESGNPASAGNAAAGAQWYPVCASCHGEHGEGITALSAPRLGGLPAAYVVRQLENFKSGVRGSDPADTYGQQMAPMAAMLPDSAAVDNVSAFIGNLVNPHAPPAAPPPGDPARGARAYQACSACHGAAAEGSPVLGAPALASQSGAYLVRQLKSFKEGRRGGPRDSSWGRQMAAAAAALPDDKSIDDVVAYIATIRPAAAASSTQ